MIIRANPNRMELLRLRKRLALSRRGHKLLQDKLEEMMRRFTALLKDIGQVKDDFQKKTAGLLRDLIYCRISASKEDFEEALAGISSTMAVSVSAVRILNVSVPVFNIERLEIGRQYDFFKASAQLDLAAAGAKDYIRSLLRLAQLLKSLDILSDEIERTRRRVNALEYVLIPSIDAAIRYISQKLNEIERDNFVRLTRIKEIVRAH